jgi:hypothetical protein
MKLNFQGVGNWSEAALLEHANFLFEYEPFTLPYGFINARREPPEGYEDYVCVDVIGKELEWMNEHFTKERYTWYVWFESVFLVTPEMATYLTLRWK